MFIQKPGKPIGPTSSLRPLTLLNAIRKILSLIALTRTSNKVNNYLSQSQSGFRVGRSTADVVYGVIDGWLLMFKSTKGK